MNPKDVSSWIPNYITKMQNLKEALAQQYIENNIELLETNVDEFMCNCSLDYVLEVTAILKAAGIDVPDVIQRATEADTALRDAFGIPMWHEPETYRKEKWVSYDLSAGEDYTWKGDKWRVKGNI